MHFHTLSLMYLCSQILHLIVPKDFCLGNLLDLVDHLSLFEHFDCFLIDWFNLIHHLFWLLEAAVYYYSFTFKIRLYLLICLSFMIQNSIRIFTFNSKRVENLLFNFSFLLCPLFIHQFLNLLISSLNHFWEDALVK